MGLRKILITLDGSDLAETALEYAIRVAEPGAHLHLLSVIVHDNTESFVSVANSVEIAFTGAPAYPIATRPTESEEINHAKVYLGKIKARLEQRGYTVSLEAVPGEVVSTIVEEAARDHFEVIVMATHGRTGFSKLVLGSVAEGVLHKSTCPVLLVPERSTAL
jgi:nucleotide-binding universal stress UspA family protein